MNAVLDTLILGLPVFLGHFGTALLMLIAGIVLYLFVTPINEYRLIKDGNLSAALTLGAATLGIALPLGAALGSSINVWDIVLWGSIAIILQISVFFSVDMILSNLSARIKRNELSAAVVVSATKLSIAALNAAAISY
ncbi:MAG: DUF350 domain-containing protein [Pseudomonadota bacterium]|nr:DUF350 domain-containing protein [Pseudomonadota bacterium]MEC8480441.1 DUF350 domain-containing protein [Pseudomonadota bacterium]MEC8695402.1 DUF350 domain-containing protein [Pseudomonadota bacterium]|tara:strand:- start:274 stop:687 length:414 start_codon:yes stop_codon:yes gene_type:complete